MPLGKSRISRAPASWSSPPPVEDSVPSPEGRFTRAAFPSSLRPTTSHSPPSLSPEHPSVLQRPLSGAQPPYAPLPSLRPGSVNPAADGPATVHGRFSPADEARKEPSTSSAACRFWPCSRRISKITPKHPGVPSSRRCSCNRPSHAPTRGKGGIHHTLTPQPQPFFVIDPISTKAGAYQ